MKKKVIKSPAKIKRSAKKESNTIRKDEPTPRYVFDKYLNCLKMENQIINAAWAERLAPRMVEWFETTPHAYKITQFLQTIGMLPEEFKRLRAKYPVLEDAHNFSMMILSNRREMGGLTNQLNTNIIAQTMAHYDRDWKALAEWRAEMAKKTDDQKYTNFKIEMTGIPNSDLVPERKNND